MFISFFFWLVNVSYWLSIYNITDLWFQSVDVLRKNAIDKMSISEKHGWTDVEKWLFKFICLQISHHLCAIDVSDWCAFLFHVKGYVLMTNKQTLWFQYTIFLLKYIYRDVNIKIIIFIFIFCFWLRSCFCLLIFILPQITNIITNKFIEVN